MSETTSSQAKRLGQLEAEVGGLKDAFGTFRQDVTSALDSIRQDFSKAREHDANQPSTVRVSLLISFGGLIATGLIIAGSVSGLVISPINDRLDDIEDENHAHETAASHDYALAQIPLLTERISENKRDIRRSTDELQRMLEESVDRISERLDRKRENLAILNAHALAQAELNGEQATINRFMIDHSNEADHPFAVIGQIQEIQGSLDELKKVVEKIDDQGSRRWNQSSHSPAGP